MNFKLDRNAPLTPLMVERYIEQHKAKEAHLTKLKNYYTGSHAITTRIMADISKPNNRLVNPYATYITDMYCGYFMGEPVSYGSEEEQFISKLTELYNYNDEASENSELAKDASICGVAYELLYLDANKDIRFRKLDPTTCIPIYDNTLENNLLYFIRYYTNTDIISGNTTTYAEVYSENERTLYILGNGAVEFLETEPHSFGDVPVIIYQNNEEERGDFESVISLIDAYDKLESDSVNEVEYFNDAYLALYGLSGTETEDIAAMKQMRVLLMPTDAKAEWLIKDVNDAYLENIKTRIAKDIHKFSMCPPMTDEDFAANASGVAMKYKLMGLENATSKKERSFKKGLQRRIEIITNMLGVFGSAFDWRSINITFKRNIPSNLLEIADVIGKIGNLISDETKMSLLPIDLDYDAEVEKKKIEAERGYTLGYDNMKQEGEDDELLGEKGS